MKKNLIALAALVAAGGASAQSSVTLYGAVDAGVSYYSVKSAYYNSRNPFAVPPLAAPAGVKKSQTALSNSAGGSSRLGFRGDEDLGGGLAASFWLESSLTNDDGAKGINDFARRSTVSLSGPFGEIRLGRDYTPTFWSDPTFDPFFGLGVGGNLIARVSTNLALARGPGSAVAATDNYARASNSIGYFLPPNLGGFYGQLQYALHENTKLSGVPGSPSKKGRYVGGRFGYASGPLDVVAAYGQSTAADTVTLSAAGLPVGAAEGKITTFNLSASYDFGPAKLFGEYTRLGDKRSTTAPLRGLGAFTTTDNDRYTSALIGVTVPVGPGLIRATYARVKFHNDLGATLPTPFGPGNQDASVQQLALGYLHYLSKRTALYATVARIRIKDGQNNPAIMGVTTGGSSTYLSTGAGVSGFAPRSAVGYNVGIRHLF